MAGNAEPDGTKVTGSKGSDEKGMAATNEAGRPIAFQDLNADQDEQEATQIESLCMKCYEQGVTQLLLTKIPFFKEVIITSFICEECGHRDSGIQSAGQIQERGCKYTLNIKQKDDLDRQVIKSEAASFCIPHMEFEQPPSPGKNGEINTMEGLIQSVIDGLSYYQPQRQETDPETGQKVALFLDKMSQLLEVEKPFDVVLDDPSGNSFIENPHAPNKDKSLTLQQYIRSPEQDTALGLRADYEVAPEEEENEETAAETGESKEKLDLSKEVMSFPTTCYNCKALCQTNMKLVDIPYFKDVVIMATVCDACGYRDSEVKGGSGIEPKGCRIDLHMIDISDLSRDVLKSDTCGLHVPEIELELLPGTLGGRFTTVEGLFAQIKDQLSEWNPFVTGDSAGGSEKQKLTAFTHKLDKVISGEMLDIHFILDDPAGNSFMQNKFAPDPDPEMSVEHYERNEEQNEMLGLTDMKTENYYTEET